MSGVPVKRRNSTSRWLLPPPVRRFREHLREIRRIAGETQGQLFELHAALGDHVERLDALVRDQDGAIAGVEERLLELNANRSADQTPDEMLVRSYYAWHQEPSTRSAEAVLPLVFDLLAPHSVVDVGCGTGTWLAVASRLGAREILGLDGGWVPSDALAISSESFIVHDLETPLPRDRHFDLAICVEVAEHLDAARADSFVEELCELADAVLFSAAIPGQGGGGHRNEQWPPYWRARFSRRRYEPVDCVRPRVWDDDRVAWWYVQSMFLYVGADRLAADQRLRAEAGRMPLSVVHPRLFERHSPPLTPPDPDPARS